MSKNFRSDLYEGGITVNPNAGAGIVAPIGTVLPRAGFSPVELWQKFGAAATQWAQVVNNNLGQNEGMSQMYLNATTVNISGGRCRSSDGTIDIEVAGTGLSASMVANLDVGVRAANTWYHLYVIASSTTLALASPRFSLSAVAPGLPAGFDKYRRIGAVRTDAAADLIPFWALVSGQYRLLVWRSDITTRQVLVGGAATGAPTSVSLATLVPPTTQVSWLQARQTGVAEGRLYDDLAAAAPIIKTVAGGSSNQLNDIMLTTAAQAIGYSNSIAGGLFQIWVTGFSEAI